MADLIDVKTVALEGKALAWCVARATGDIEEGETFEQVMKSTRIWWLDYEPQEDWSHGGRLIEEYGVSIVLKEDGEWWAGIDACTQSMAGMAFRGADEYGSTPLEAACRAIVASKLGQTVFVPAELL